MITLLKCKFFNKIIKKTKLINYNFSSIKHSNLSILNKNQTAKQKLNELILANPIEKILNINSIICEADPLSSEETNQIEDSNSQFEIAVTLDQVN